jgi:hypothetical protein
MSGLGKQLRGTGIAKVINARTGFKDGSDPFDKNYQGDKFKPISLDPESMDKEDKGPDLSTPTSHMKRAKKSSGGKVLKQVNKEKNPGLAKLPTPVRNKMGYMKDGGSAKPGLWANINRRKRLGISRPKSQTTISKKAYANMKAGFPKKGKK